MHALQYLCRILDSYRRHTLVVARRWRALLAAHSKHALLVVHRRRVLLIAHKDKDFNTQTGRDKSGGLAPRVKCFRKPLAVVRDRSNLPLFLHLAYHM